MIYKMYSSAVKSSPPGTLEKSFDLQVINLYYYFFLLFAQKKDAKKSAPAENRRFDIMSS